MSCLGPFFCPRFRSISEQFRAKSLQPLQCSGFRKRGLANSVFPFFVFCFLLCKLTKKNGEKKKTEKRKKTEENGRKRKNSEPVKTAKQRKKWKRTKKEENGKKRKKTEKIGSDTAPATHFAKSRLVFKCRAGIRGSHRWEVEIPPKLTFDRPALI